MARRLALAQRRLHHASAESRRLRGRVAALERALAQERGRRQADARRSLLAAMVADLASGFVNAQIDAVDRAQLQSLQELCHAVGGDRCAITTWDASSRVLRWGHGWRRSGIAEAVRPGDAIPLAGQQAWLTSVTEGQTLDIPARSALAANDPLHALLDGWNTGSLLALPLMEEERCTGFLVIETVGREVRWGHDEFSALVIAAELFANSSMRRQRELALERALTDAKASIRAKDAFLATMSHELRTPLNGVIGMAELLQGSTLDKTQRTYVSTISSASLGLLGVLQSVVDLARIEAGRAEPELRECDLRELVAEVARTVSCHLDPARVDLLVAIDPSVPGTLLTDPNCLRQMLVNLVGNGVKFTQDGFVSVRFAVADGMLSVTVADSGPGIPAAMLPRLFRPFELADDSHTRRHGGAGVGLSISQRMATLLGGSLTVASTEGRGSTFTLLLPLTAMAKPPAAAAPRLAGIRLLVVDDGDEARRAAVAELASSGAAVEATATAAEAIAVLAEAATHTPFDAAVVDLHLAGMDAAMLGEALAEDPTLAGLPLIGWGSATIPPPRLRAVVAKHAPAPALALGVAGTLASNVTGSGA